MARLTIGIARAGQPLAGHVVLPVAHRVHGRISRAPGEGRRHRRLGARVGALGFRHVPGHERVRIERQADGGPGQDRLLAARGLPLPLVGQPEARILRRDGGILGAPGIVAVVARGRGRSYAAGRGRRTGIGRLRPVSVTEIERAPHEHGTYRGRRGSGRRRVRECRRMRHGGQQQRSAAHQPPRALPHLAGHPTISPLGPVYCPNRMAARIISG
jgi:hypothetical protein